MCLPSDRVNAFWLYRISGHVFQLRALPCLRVAEKNGRDRTGLVDRVTFIRGSLFPSYLLPLVPKVAYSGRLTLDDAAGCAAIGRQEVVM